jgi:hypothetical protein
LTPKGFLEKSQLVGSYFYHSFDFFRRARTSCETTLGALAELGHARVGLVGASELAEIAAIVAADMNIRITAVVDPDLQRPQFVGIPVVASAEAASDIVDVVMITSLLRPRESYEAAAEALGMARVFMPALLADLAVRRPSEQQQHEREAKRRNSA